MRGSLFTEDFLKSGIAETTAWRRLPKEEFTRFRDRIGEIFSFPAASALNEAATEADIIWPVLEALGWAAYLPQQTAAVRGRSDVPDVLLFSDRQTKDRAMAERSEDRRYPHGIAIVESKRWLRPLDRSDRADATDAGAPSTQMLRYLSRVEVLSNRRITWGILTNGRHWRLYWQGARSRSEEFLELDLPQLVGMPGLQEELFGIPADKRAHYLKVFFLLFRRESFLPEPEDTRGRTLHGISLEETRLWEEIVSKNLGEQVFHTIFPALVRAMAEGDPDRPRPLTGDYLEEVRRASLTFLYRMLFLLYAEDRDLLSPRDARYDDYSLRHIRLDIARRVDGRDVFSNRATRYHDHLRNLFRAVDEGDSSIGLPPYNGGLFEPAAHSLLERVRLPDGALAPVIDALCRRRDGEERHWINYRDLAVQHLGAIYERLLEFAAVPEPDGTISIRPNKFARKTTGSFYTHDSLVGLILERAVGPLLAERRAAFREEAERLAHDRRPRAERLRELERLDPAVRFLDLKICDPAMGSSHFLVGLVDYLADRILEQMAEAEALVAWQTEEEPYRSPLAARIEDVRSRILATARREGWTLAAEQLDDRHLVRRMILKRVIYGVDKNPMAVELAKVSLWLHTFTVGAPLSFLDHHLRCGDSLFGEWVLPVLDEMRKRGALFMQRALVSIGSAAEMMNRISELTDADIAEVRASKEQFGRTDELTRPLRAFLDFWQALRWICPDGLRASKRNPVHPGVAPLLDGVVGDPFEVVASGGAAIPPSAPAATAAAVRDLLTRAAAVAERERFLHWELGFPTVWRGLHQGRSVGGFDAVIGNPPWDRMKLQEVEWFAARRPEIALAQRAADRKRMVQALERSGDPLWGDYLEAGEVAETSAKVARSSGQYPLLSGGDVNLYSLFVERAGRLVAAEGIVGLLTPSGIASDLGASEFFRGVAASGRLGAVLDFENKKFFFPDIHASFKFCAFVFGGSDRAFPEARCAFFLHRVEELADPNRSFAMGPDDFAAVNPNTGTAPIFRTRRDAEIAKGVYARVPVLVDRRAVPPRQAWPVKYLRMFDMTNDSHFFRTRAALEAEGCYPVGGNRWKRGAEEFVPLYVGRMINRYDHRAAGVEVNEENLHNPALSGEVTPEQKKDPTFVPTPQYWVNAAAIEWPEKLNWIVGFRDIARTTDARTVIACIVPHAAFGNTLPLVFPETGGGEIYRSKAPLLLAMLNSFAFDYVARQKVQSTHLNWYIVEQLPVLPPETFDREMGGQTLADFVRGEVLRLTYTAEDMRPFARDMGCEGNPFPWDEEDRRHRTARLDALLFHLYGVGREDAAYILDTFPIIREQDERLFGRFRTKELILAYMNAVAAGDLMTAVRG